MIQLKLADGAKVLCIQWKLYFEFCILLLSSFPGLVTGGTYSLVMLGRQQPQLLVRYKTLRVNNHHNHFVPR